MATSPGTVNEIPTAPGTGAYSLNAGLNANTKYFYRAYAKNDCATPQTGYSHNTPVTATQYIVTLPISTTSNAASNISNNEFRANWTNPGAGGGETYWYNLTVEKWDGSAWVAFGTYNNIPSGTPYYDVTGATANTRYRYHFNSENAGGVSILPSNWTEVTTTSSITWANVQPVAPNPITEPASATIYARVFADGSTNLASPAQGPNISAWIGYSTANSNPSGAGWTWVSASYFGNDGTNNDEYSAVLSGLSPGTYYYASRFQSGTGAYFYGGVNNAPWASTSDNGVLTVNPNKVSWGNYQHPHTGTYILGDSFNVYGRVYQPGITDVGSPGNGITAEVGYSTTNTDPATWSAASWKPATFNTDADGADEYTRNIGADISVDGTYYVAFRYKLTGGSTWYYAGHGTTANSGGEWNGNTYISGVITVTRPREINIKQGGTNIVSGGTYTFGNQISGTSSSVITFTVENTGQNDLSVGALSISGTNAGEYTITQPENSTVAGGYTTTFTVTFSPTTTGPKTAQLSLVNDDANENPYIINLTGTGTASATSDVIVAPYTYPTNIAYANYQATDITGAIGAVEIAKFTIRDGGATADADNLGTTVNSLTVGLTNAANIRKIALYDGATELGELAATASNAFTGLNIIVADGTTKDFSVRVSFNTSVTDNQQIQVSVTGAAAATSGSGFGTVNAVATVTGNENKIVVIADRLAFTTQPVTTGVNSPMSNVVVSASDNNNNKDLDYSGNIVITSTGTLTGSPVTVASASGVATFSGLTHTVVGTGLKLTATSTGLTDAISNAFDITTITYIHGDYRTKSSGTWSYNPTTPGSTQWERYSSTLGWQDYVGQPTAATEYTAYITLNTEIPTDATGHGKAKIVVTKDETTGLPATLVFNPSSNWTFRNVIIENGATLEMKTVGFNVLADRNFEIKDGGNFIFNLSSTAAAGLTGSLWNGVEVFHPASNFIVKNHETGSGKYFFPPADKLSSNTYNGVTAYFGNLLFDPIVKDLRFTTTNLNNTTVTHGNLEIRPYGIGSGSQTLLYGSVNWTIGGNFIIGQNSNDTSTTNINLTTGTNTIVFNVKGDFINNSGNTLTFTSNPSASTTINLEGDMQIGSIGKLISAGSTNATLNFAGTWVGNKDDPTIQTIDVANAATASNIAFNVNSGAYVKLINQDLALGSSSSFNVKNGGTLDFGFSPSNLALNITNHVNTAAFKTEANSTIKITSSEGITNTTGSGNVRTMTTGRVFDKGATYHYIGKVNQATGNGIPDQITGKLIVELETQNATQDDLEFRSTGTTTFGTTGGINGLLEIRKGKVFDDPSKGFRNYNGTVDENNDGEADVQKGDLVMKGGKYVVSGGGFKPSLSGNYTLNSGTVEFAGNNNTKIRVKPAYFNVDVSGSNVTPGGKNLVVNNELKVISATAVLTIPEVPDNENPYVVTAKKGIQIAEGGEAIFKNNAILMQEKDAVNTGDITMERKATVPSVQYNYWSSPVKDQPLYSLYPGIPDNKVMVYNSANDRFTVLPTSSNPKSVFAKGYSIKGSSNTDYAPALTAKFVGEPHNETTAGITSMLLSTAGSNYNLIGNPYPSNLNLLELFADGDNNGKFYNVTSGPDIETPTAYFWDNTSNTDLTQQGSGYVNMNYALLNLSTGIGTPAPRLATTGKKPNGILKPGQGFIMRAAESGGSLTIKNTHRTSLTKPLGGTDGVYYKANEATTDKFWLTLTTPNQMNIVIALAYHPEAENSFERFDSMIFSEAVTENFYSLSSDARKLAIQSRKGDFNTEDKIPLGIKSSETGLQKISLESNYGAFDNQPIYLKDKLLNTLTNLSDTPYEFTTAMGVDENRFEIVYKPGTVLATDSGIKETLTVYRNANDIIVKSKHSRIDEVEVYDVSGRLIIKVKGGSDELRINASSYISGTYVLKIKCDEKTVTKKILK
ncbi:choice-of-anchor D domain-containing protein [Kaistella sp.]|uniref:choice-of-anchor D domain-containing protein n=1 Tax=Kaistella sp. TaxID=2782235 RepID=UPI002F938113